MIRQGQPTFAGLEIGDDLQSRYDTAKYATALRRARNVLGRVGGGFASRPGLEFVAEVKDSTLPARIAPFQFSLTQSYVIEFGNETLRLSYGGGMVARPELIVTGITNANPAVATIPDNGYQVGWDVFFAGILGMTQINGLVLRVTAVVGDSVTLDANSTAWGVFTGATGGVAGGAEGGTGGLPVDPPITDPPPPYVDEEPTPPVIRCVDADALLFSGVRAGSAAEGDKLLLLADDGLSTHDGRVTANSTAMAPRYRLTTVSGIRLTVSDTAPVPTWPEDHGGIVYVVASALVGDECIPVHDFGELRWERLEMVEALPDGLVAKISAADSVYAAGDQPGRFIFTHNKIRDPEEF